jgi:hypothetical protein
MQLFIYVAVKGATGQYFYCDTQSPFGHLKGTYYGH